MPPFIKRRLAHDALLYRLATLAGLTRLPKLAVQAAAQRGETLKFKWSGARWQKGREVVLFPPENPASITYYMERMPAFYRRLIFTPSGAFQVADLRRPAKYRLPSGGSLWLPSLAEPLDFFSGYFEQGGPQAGQVVLDAGAYCGETTLEMAVRVGPTGHVFAFEPDEKNLRWLRRNVEESGLKNITVVPKGLWSTTTTLAFLAEESPASVLVSSSDGGREKAVATQIEVLSPHDAFALIGRVPDFIKMDIEGAEVEVVEAMAPLLTETKTRLAIASYHVREGRKTCELIGAPLLKAGLSVKTGYAEHLTTWAWRAQMALP